MRDKNRTIVEKLCTDWPQMSLAQFQELMASDCQYTNMPKPTEAKIGPEGAHGALSRAGQVMKVDCKILNTLADDARVFCERLERFERRDNGVMVELYVTGVFDMEDGKIAAWRDYYDDNTMKPLRP